MKKEILPATLLTVLCLFLFSGVYTGIVWGIGQLTPNQGEGERIKKADGSFMYANIAQRFTEDRYFQSRPSAVDYNAAGSGGSNKGPSTPEYLATVQKRIDSFLSHNPGVRKNQIQADLVTASGSGLDPDVSVAGAMVQVKRVALARDLDEYIVTNLVTQHLSKPLWGFMGPERVNVLQLNMALDQLK